MVMERNRIEEDRVVATDDASTRVARQTWWSPAQLVALAVGLTLTVIGGVALARSGLEMHDVPATRVMVGGLHSTSMSALIQLVTGVLVLAGAAVPSTVKSTITLFGVVLLAFGLIVAISPTSFTTMWGFTTANGVLYAVLGGLLLLAAAVSPVYFSQRQVTTRRHGDSRVADRI